MELFGRGAEPPPPKKPPPPPPPPNGSASSSSSSSSSDAAFAAAAERLLGQPFAHMLQQDLIALQDTGHERLGTRAAKLRDRYAAIDHPAAREIIRWLDGDDLMTDAEVQTQ